ncbi:2-oxo acid dehydrogenase subunit E2 [Streptomyces justiciae]|uniref:2-oxo acid dehydrogenase subunit E2 n=1 Tax=Streptomyces justiciae TaxID=2780140 RepID=UPI002117988F|nr:2-oxo acid dehydrogenase subunit E2 [Streptomyces justiciae]MCW8376122.1 2-oxo acid dehydrogenase subunit E2 [Streptomyces justiciae]
MRVTGTGNTRVPTPTADGTSTAAPARTRGIETGPFPASRRLVVAAERAGRRRAAMHSLVELDVTTARELIAAADRPVSFTAFVAASVARTAAAHPQTHTHRDWRGRLVRHRHVDVTTMVEVATGQGLFALPHVLRDADVRDVHDLTSELREAKADPAATATGGLLERFGASATRVPGLLPLMYTLLSRSPRVRQLTGTVAVTAVGMFGADGGFGIAPPTVMPLQVVVGGLAERPRVTDGRIGPRTVLDLTVTFDHNVIDGAPAARFMADLRRCVESAEVLCAAG